MSTIREYTYSDVDADDSEPIVITENNRIRNTEQEEIVEVEEAAPYTYNNNAMIVAIFIGILIFSAIAYLLLSKSKGKNGRSGKGGCRRSHHHNHHDHEDRGYEAGNKKKSGNCQGGVCSTSNVEE